MRTVRWAVVLGAFAISGCSRSYDAYRGAGSREGAGDGMDSAGGEGDRDAANRRSRPGASVVYSSESRSRGIGLSSRSSERGILILEPDR